jgi:hypothetical protein
MFARTAQRPLRWYQFRLRTLVAAVTLIVGVLGAGQLYLAPYRQQRTAMKVIEGLGGSYESVEASLWHRRLLGSGQQDITLADVSNCDDPAAYLPYIERLPLLEVLAVGGEAFGDEQLGRLKRVRTLRFLVLDGTSVSDEAVAELCRAIPELDVYRSQRRTIAELKTQLQRVYTLAKPSPNGLGSALNPELFALAREVWADYQAVSDDVLLTIASLDSIKVLSLSGSDVTDERLAHLRDLTDLRELSLARTQVTDAGLKHLESLGSLSVLVLNSTGVTDQGLEQISRLNNLEVLELWGTDVTDQGLVHLAKMPKLRGVSLGDTRVTTAGLDRLHELKRIATKPWVSRPPKAAP